MPGAIAFDLDGTLVDSVRDIHDALAATLDHHAGLTVAVTRTLVGHGARHLVEQALRHVGVDAAERVVDDTLARFRAIYDAAPANHTVPYEGILDLLHTLRAEGVSIAVCTNKPAPLARVVVREVLAGAVDIVVGPEDAGALKPDPAMLQVAAARLSQPIRAFVGDSSVDAETARRSHVPFVFVTWGLGARESVVVERGVTAVDDTATLLVALDALLRDA
jgi:phosphoglycolate phosphatase